MAIWFLTFSEIDNFFIIKVMFICYSFSGLFVVLQSDKIQQRKSSQRKDFKKLTFGSAGHVIYVVETLLPITSSTKLWMSLSVIRLMWPFRTFLSHIWRGLLPILYKIDKNPDWNVFLNMIFCYFLFSSRVILYLFFFCTELIFLLQVLFLKWFVWFSSQCCIV